MAKSQHIIQAFPTNIDRRDFGNFVSGFTAGEGSFVLRLTLNKKRGWSSPTAIFTILLRRDDREILDMIQSYFGVGKVYLVKKSEGDRKDTKPKSCYYVGRIVDLYSVIVPHFDQYPLFAKKRRDFLIWRQAVELLYRVTRKKRRWRGNHRGGMLPVWSPEERSEFDEISSKLKGIRLYESTFDPSNMAVTPKKPPKETQGNFLEQINDQTY